jgi:hypothetical protein
MGKINSNQFVTVRAHTQVRPYRERQKGELIND